MHGLKFSRFLKALNTQKQNRNKHTETKSDPHSSLLRLSEGTEIICQVTNLQLNIC